MLSVYQPISSHDAAAAAAASSAVTDGIARRSHVTARSIRWFQSVPSVVSLLLARSVSRLFSPVQSHRWTNHVGYLSSLPGQLIVSFSLLVDQVRYSLLPLSLPPTVSDLRCVICGKRKRIRILYSAILSPIHTADATQLDSCVASASVVCIGNYATHLCCAECTNIARIIGCA